MSTYSTTATVAGVETVADLHRPHIAVNRNGIESTDGARVRLDVYDSAGEIGVVYLTAEAAEELGVAIALAAEDTGEVSPIGGRRHPRASASDAALLAVTDAVTAARTAGNTPALILARVADGLTGKLAGYVERAAGHAMTAAYDTVVATPVEDLKAAELEARR